MFKKPRRVPRKVGRDEGEDGQRSTIGVSHLSGDPDDEPAVVVKRPQAQSKLAKAKKAHVASVRAVLDYEQDNEAQDVSGTATQDDPFAALERKKSAAQKNRASLASSRLPIRSPESVERPMYNADYLASLRSEQQTAPRPIDPSDDMDLDLDPEPEPEPAPMNEEPSIVEEPAADPSINIIRMTDSTKTAIPTDTEIREKIERRRRLALEAKADEYISLDDNDKHASSDSDSPRKRNLIIPADELAPKTKYPESRLGGAQLDDDDFGEGYDAFVEDAGRVTLGRKAARAQAAARRADMQAQIARAERASESGSDDSSRARTRAYEAAQTRRGTYGERRTDKQHRATDARQHEESRWRRLLSREYAPKAAAGDLGAAVARFEARAAGVRAEREAAQRRLQTVQAEREENAREQERVRGLVREAGEKLERLLRGADGVDAGVGGTEGGGNDGGGGPGSGSGEDDEDDSEASGPMSEDDDEDMAAAPGLGSSAAAAASAQQDFMTGRPTSFGGMGRPPSPEW